MISYKKTSIQKVKKRTIVSNETVIFSINNKINHMIKAIQEICNFLCYSQNNGQLKIYDLTNFIKVNL